MIKKLLINSFRIISSIIFPLVTLPYVSRVLQPTGFGKVDFANSIISIFLMFASLGIPTYGIRLVAKSRNNISELSNNVKQLLLLQIIGIIICYIVFAICLFFVPMISAEKMLFVILSINILMNGIGIEWLFSGLEDYGYIAIRNGIFQIISIILIFLLIKKPSDYIYYAAITVFSTLGSNVLNIFYLTKKINIKEKVKLNLTPHFKGALVFFILILLGTSLTKIESIMIGFFLNYKEVGIYAGANKIIQSIIGLFSGIGMTFLPTLINLSNNSKLQFNEMLEKSADAVYFIVLPICFALYILAPQVINLLLGHNFNESILPFRILVGVILVTTLNVVICNQTFMVFHKEKYAALPIIVLALVSPALNYVLIPIYGVVGASLSLLAASIISFTIQMWLSIQINKIRWLKIAHLKYLLASLIMAILIMFMNVYGLNLMVVVTSACLVYITTLLILKEYFTCNIINKLNQSIK